MERWLLSCVLQVAILLTFASAKSLRDLSSNEFQNLAKSTSQSFVGVYFDSKDARRKHPIFLKEYRKAAGYLEAYGIELARVDCDSESLNECKELKVHTYREGEFEETTDLDALFNLDSIVANLLQILLKNELGYIYDTSYASDILKTARGSKDVIFTYVRGLGTKAHRTVVEVAFVYGSNVTFALTTDRDVAKQVIPGFSEPEVPVLVGYLCKTADVNSDKACTTHTYHNKFKIPQIARFIELMRLPQLVELSRDGKTVYDNTQLTVNKVYVFVDKSKDSAPSLQDVSVQLAKSLFGTAGVVYVDVKSHADKLAHYGLSELTLFPTAALLPFTKNGEADEKTVELFPEKTFDFTLDSVKKFVLNILDNPPKEYKRLASESSTRVLLLQEFKSGIEAEELAPYHTDYIMTGYCEHDNPDAGCIEFAKSFRRLARTFDRQLSSDFTPVYVQLSKEDVNQEFASGVPSLRLYSQTKGVYRAHSDLTGPRPDYDGMMRFIRDKTEVTTIDRLPPSNTDLVPIESRLKKSEEDENTGASKDDQSDEDDDEEGSRQSPAEETEDDEVAGAVWYTSPPKVPIDKVPSLTDKTFSPSQQQHDLLMVNFFQPWDPRSRAIIGPYLDAALNLGKIDIGNYDVQLARVNCFDWTDVCQANNITTYPTIKLYRKGLSEEVYRGPLDADHFVKAVLLLHQPSPIALTSNQEVNTFLKGELPRGSAQASPISVFGVFSSEESKEFKAFKAVAENLRGEFLLGYMTGKAALTEAMSHGLQLPAIMAIKRDDPIVRRAVFDGDYNDNNIEEFVRLSRLQSFGELTPINLPLYHQHRRPLLVAFRENAHEDKVYAPVMQQMAADHSLPNVFLCWMPISGNDVNGAVLESYTGDRVVPALVLVDHSKAAVYQYDGAANRKAVIEWASSCLADDKQPSSKLKEKKWEPLLEGYDYLKMIDEEEEEKKMKKKKRMEGEEEDQEAVDAAEEPAEVVHKKRDRLRQRKPEDFRQKEEQDENAHDEL